LIVSPRNIEIQSVKRSGRRTSEQSDRAKEIGTEDIDGANDAGFTSHCEPIDVAAFDEYCARVKADCFHNPLARRLSRSISTSTRFAEALKGSGGWSLRPNEELKAKAMLLALVHGTPSVQCCSDLILK
jgi:hypothetical protein